jgi:UDP-glucose 4-epimerase
MRILIFGGTGFVGLNIAATLLARGHSVTLFDRADVPLEAGEDFAPYGARLTVIQSDVTDNQAVEAVIASGYDAIVLGAAITAGAAREASDPETILRVNLLAQTPILIAARSSGVRRVINLSSAAAYGASAFRNVLLDEETPCDPASLYAITKFASEKVAARLAGLWQQEIINVRLSALFGPGSGATMCATRRARRRRFSPQCTRGARPFCRARASGTGFMQWMSRKPWHC